MPPLWSTVPLVHYNVERFGLTSSAPWQQHDRLQDGLVSRRPFALRSDSAAAATCAYLARGAVWIGLGIIAKTLWRLWARGRLPCPVCRLCGCLRQMARPFVEVSPAAVEGGTQWFVASMASTQSKLSDLQVSDLIPRTLRPAAFRRVRTAGRNSRTAEARGPAHERLGEPCKPNLSIGPSASPRIS
jgi:hypothetical protein